MPNLTKREAANKLASCIQEIKAAGLAVSTTEYDSSEYIQIYDPIRPTGAWLTAWEECK